MATGLPANRDDANNEWVLDFSTFRTAWSMSKGAGITIAHPDTGWTMHPELVPPTYRRDLSKNFYDAPRISRVSPPNDDRLNARDRDGFMSSAHGTGTAGVLGSPRGHPNGARPDPDETDKFAEGSPGAYVSGAAPEATVIPFRVAGHPFMRDAEDEALAKCIYHCIGLFFIKRIDVAVMSISLGGFRLGTEKKIKDALVAAREAGIIMIAAAGQVPSWLNVVATSIVTGSAGSPVFPGSSPDTICVAGCNWQHRPLFGGFYGKEVDISGPAVNVWMSRTRWVDSAPQGEEYRVERSYGTSYSTALTAAACALWQSYHGRKKLIELYGRPRLHAAFRYCLRQSADRRPDWDTNMRGAGALDAERLLALPLPSVEDVDRQVPK